MYKRRRTRIKLISILFAGGAVALLVVLAIFLLDTKKMSPGEFFLSRKGNSFSKVQFKTYDHNKKEISLQADDVCENEKNNYTLKNMLSTFALPNGKILIVTANSTKVHRKDKTLCELIGNVKLSMESGLRLETDKMFIDFTKKIANGDTEIIISQDDTKLFAEKYIYDSESNILTLKGKARGLFGINKISSDELIIHLDNTCGENIKSILATGDVVYSGEIYTLKAKKIRYSNDKIEAWSDVVLFFKKNGSDCETRADFMQASIKRGKIDSIKANGSLIIKTKNVTIRAQEGIFNGEKIKVIGNVIISEKQGNIFGNNATLNLKTDDISIDKASGIIVNGIHK
ncbi:MAG: LPS export ABC transporter periplasmic protein LptC [Holosporaceae bacterium]|nr:LPS export ABC transporter periplasmic protein LptC [Holosporaceae bacterium]